MFHVLVVILYEIDYVDIVTNMVSHTATVLPIAELLAGNTNKPIMAFLLCKQTEYDLCS